MRRPLTVSYGTCIVYDVASLSLATVGILQAGVGIGYAHTLLLVGYAVHTHSVRILQGLCEGVCIYLLSRVRRSSSRVGSV